MKEGLFTCPSHHRWIVWTKGQTGREIKPYPVCSAVGTSICIIRLRFPDSFQWTLGIDSRASTVLGFTVSRDMAGWCWILEKQHCDIWRKNTKMDTGLRRKVLLRQLNFKVCSLPQFWLKGRIICGKGALNVFFFLSKPLVITDRLCEYFCSIATTEGFLNHPSLPQRVYGEKISSNCRKRKG